MGEGDGHLRNHTKIRPEHLHEQYRQLQQLDQAELFANAAAWPRRACPLCGEYSHRAWIAHDDLAYVRCVTCGLVHLQPCPPPTVLEDYYANSKSAAFFQEKILLPTAPVRSAQLFGPRVAAVRECAAHDGERRLLDVGCSIGTFLELAAADGWNCAGVEPNRAARNIACEKKFDVASDIVAAAPRWPAASFDVITAWEIIAHVHEPRALLQHAVRLLRPGGVVLLTTPNVAALEYRLLHARHPNFCFPFLQLFSAVTVTRLLTELGLHIESCTTPGRMDVENIAAGWADQSSNFPPALQELLWGTSPRDRAVRAALQSALAQVGESGHLRVVARKPK